MLEHLLDAISLPDRYERLEERVGSEVARLLIPPSAGDLSGIKLLARDAATRDEGTIVPVFGVTGAGKTTFVDNLGSWLPADFTATLTYEGELTYDALASAVQKFTNDLPTNNEKIIPINIDHRESNPPTDGELSAVKRFLRTKGGGAPSIVFWPEIDRGLAEQLARRYTSIAGGAAIDLPLIWHGPERRTWQDIAKHTLSVANQLSNLELLGVNPDDYNPEEYPSLGSFLRRLSQEFNRQKQELRDQLEKPVTIVIAFVSESNDPGVLSQFTTPSHYGLLDAHALVSVTSGSDIGRWWSTRRGLLTRTIVQLNARAISVPPTAAASCVRNFTDSMPMFDKVGYRRYGPARGVRDLARSDLGKIVLGERISRFEARGTPPEDAAAAFSLLSEEGFNLGKDKSLNGIMRDALEALLGSRGVEFLEVTAERKLQFCPLIPDNAIYFEDGVTCVEYTWRSGAFLASKNRATAAAYILGKLRNYSRELGWHTD